MCIYSRRVAQLVCFMWAGLFRKGSQAAAGPAQAKGRAMTGPADAWPLAWTGPAAAWYFVFVFYIFVHLGYVCIYFLYMLVSKNP